MITIPLTGIHGYELRQKAANYLDRYATTTGAERGNLIQQGSGLLAEIVIRNNLNLPDIQDDLERHTSFGYDILSATGIKIDIKCRGGKKPFDEYYSGTGSIMREAKHNYFARQVYDNSLQTDIYLMTHLRLAGDGSLPGSNRQRNWCLYICGWVSKERVIREGVYLERGSLTEQGNTWFTYRGQEIEFYQKNLNTLNSIQEILSLTQEDVIKDQERTGHYNLTRVDAIRIAMDLYARGLLTTTQLDFVKKDAKIKSDVEPILNNNQYLHLAEWLFRNKKLTKIQLDAIKERFPFIPFTGV